MNHKFLVRLAVAIACMLGVALGISPAFAATAAPASSTPLQANVQVSQSITFMLSTSSFTISGLAGTTATAPNADTETVTTADPAGYTITVTPSGDFVNGSRSFPVSDLSDNNGAVIPIAETGPTTLVSSSAAAPNGTVYTDSWSVAIPAGASTGTYTTTLNFTATAN